MDNEIFFEKFNDLTAKLGEKVININRGGCGIFAFHFSEILDKFSIEHSLFALAYYNTNKETYYNSLKSLYSNLTKGIPIGLNHVAVKINDTLYDCHGESPEYGQIWEIQKPDLHLLIDYGNWNSVYRREVCNPILFKHLEEFENELTKITGKNEKVTKPIITQHTSL